MNKELKKMEVQYTINRSFFQEGEKRYESAMAGVPDRVPVAAQMHEFAMKEGRYNAREFYTDARIFVPY